MQAHSFNDVKYELAKCLAGTMAAALENKIIPFENCPSAPDECWNLFEKAVVKIDLSNWPKFQLLGFQNSPDVPRPTEVRIHL